MPTHATIRSRLKELGGKYIRVGYSVNAGGIRVGEYFEAWVLFSNKKSGKELGREITRFCEDIFEPGGWSARATENMLGWVISGQKRY